MLPAVVLDPSTFWLSTGGDEDPLVEELVTSAVLWLKRSPLDKFRILISAKMLERLAAVGVFPAQPHFDKIIRRSNLHHIVSPRELATYVARFMSNAPTIEDNCSVQDGLFENCQIAGDLFSSIGPIELREVSNSVCVLVAVNAKAEKDEKEYFYGYNRINSDTVTAQVSAGILMLDPEKFGEIVGGEISAEMKFIRIPDDYYSCLDADKIWRDAKSAYEIHLAIGVAAKAIAAQSGATVKKCHVGTEFLDALKRSQALGQGAHSSVVLGKCAQVVAGAANLDIHDFRESAAADSAVKIRERDQARARRLHITGGHAGLRLMFWECPAGHIEFSTVRNKFDPQIDEGDPVS